MDLTRRGEPVSVSKRQAALLAQMRRMREVTVPVLPDNHGAELAARFDLIRSTGRWSDGINHAKRAVEAHDKLLRALRRVQNRVNALNRAVSATEDLPTFRLGDLDQWREVARDAETQLREQGYSARSIATWRRRTAKAEISEGRIRDECSTLAWRIGVGANRAARLSTRAYAAALLELAICHLNLDTDGHPWPERFKSTGPTPDYSRSLAALERALNSGHDGLTEAGRMHQLGETGISGPLERLRATKTQGPQALTLTRAVLDAVDAAVIGNFLTWALAWSDMRLVGGPGQTGRTEDATEPGAKRSTGRGAASVVTVSGEVSAISIGVLSTTLEVTPRHGAVRTVKVDGTNVEDIGLLPGSWVEATGYATSARGAIEVFAAPGTMGDWEGRVRGITRSAFIARPFGLDIVWSWQRGPAGAAALLANHAWFG